MFFKLKLVKYYVLNICDIEILPSMTSFLRQKIILDFFINI